MRDLVSPKERLAFIVVEMKPRRLKPESETNSYRFGRDLLAAGWDAGVGRILPIGQKRVVARARSGWMQAVFWGRIDRMVGVVGERMKLMTTPRFLGRTSK